MTNQTIKVTWHGHSCFQIDNGTWSLVLDPYKPEMIGYPPLMVKAHAMLASHDHEDHHYRDSVNFLPAPENPLRFVDLDAPWPDTDDAYFYVKTLQTYHDDAKGKKRGLNQIHIIHTTGFTMAHLGDLGHLLSQEQADAIGLVDLLLLPVGGYYTIDAKEAVLTAKLLQPRNVAPMHYQIGFGRMPITTAAPFLEKITEADQVKFLSGPDLHLKAEDQGNCFVFQYKKS